MKKKLGVLSAAAVLSLGVTGTAFAQEGGQQTFEADLTPQNGSGSTGTATMTLDSNQLGIDIGSQGLTPNLPHAQHIHGMAQAISECPSGLALDANGDGLVSTPEGQPAYGPILASLTVTGDTTPESATAVDRMPKAGADGTLAYSRTLTLPADVAANLGDFAIVQHGIDVDGSGKYDGAPSDIKPEIPLEGTLPTDCGKIVPTSSAAMTMPETGGINLVGLAAGLAGGALAVGGLFVSRVLGSRNAAQ